MLDDHHGVALVHQTLEHVHQLVDVGGVQAGGGLVQNIDGGAGGLPGKLGGQLHPLGFAAGQGGGGLAQLDVAQAHVHEGLKLVADLGQILEEGQGLLHRHLQHLVDVFALVAHLESLPVVALALAHLAGDVDVWQEVHLDLQQAVAGAGLAPSAPDVEGEPARAVSPALGVLGGGEQLPDVVEQPGVGGGVGAGRPADGGLVDGDDLVEELDALHAVVPAGPGLGAVELHAQPLVEDLVDQRRLARAGHAGDGDERPQREGHVDVPEVVFRRAPDDELIAVPRPAGGRDRYLFPAGKVVAGDGAGGVHNVLCRAAGHHVPAVDARAGADVHDVVGGPHGVFVVLHHDEGVAQIPQVLEGTQQQVIVPLVQADGRLVQNIQHPHEGGADLGGQPDALALAAGQGARLTAEGQVLEPYRAQEAQPGADLLQDLVGDHHLGVGEGDGVEEGQRLVHRLFTEVVDGDAAHRHRQ